MADYFDQTIDKAMTDCQLGERIRDTLSDATFKSVELIYKNGALIVRMWFVRPYDISDFEPL